MNANRWTDLPFPYFLLDQQLNIKKTSLRKQLIGNNMENLIEKSERKVFRWFLSQVPPTESMIFSIYLEQNEHVYRIYKYVDGDEQYHLFCHPVTSLNYDTLNLVNKMNAKVNETNSQIDENKQLVKKLKKEYNQLALQLDYFSNVGKLAAGIAHEIRNPLTVVKGFIQLMKPYLEKHGKEDYAKIAIEEIDRANRIIYEFLNTTKANESEKREAPLNQLLNEVKLLLEIEANLHNITLQTKFDKKNPTVLIDVNQIKQVLINLVKNSMEAIHLKNEGNGEISICTKVAGEQVYIYITDNGCGMSEEIIKNLFTPFYTTKTEGTGLGLYICRQIVNEHNGKMYIDSEVGKGTMFTIELPLYDKIIES